MATHQIRIEDAQLVAPDHVLFTLIAPAEFRARHALPGQYAMVTYPGDEKARPLAFASSPGADPLMFLVRTDAPDALLAHRGKPLTITEPEGRGFLLEQAQGGDVLIVVTGSAIAPIRSVLELMVRNRGAFGAISVLYGVRTVEQVVFADDLARYAAADVDITVCVSGGGDARHPVLPTKPGRVQSHLPETVRAGTTLIVCGQFPMMDDVTAQLKTRGLDPSRAQRNF